MKFEEAVEGIVKANPRYTREAYGFVAESLEFTMQLLKKPQKGTERHVTGQQLTDGIRQYALRQFGPMAIEVLSHWGVTRCEDFGMIVFQLVEKNVLGKTDRDSLEDFKGAYDFEDAFAKPFRIKKKTTIRPVKPKTQMRQQN